MIRLLLVVRYPETYITLPEIVFFLAPRVNNTEFKFIPVNRSQLDLTTLKSVLKVISSGEPILVFPEGTRSIDGSLGHGKKGIGLLLAKSQTIVVPARVFGGNEILGKGMFVPRIGRKLVIIFGNPIEMKDLDPGKSELNRYEIISTRVLDAISKLDIKK